MSTQVAEGAVPARRTGFTQKDRAVSRVPPTSVLVVVALMALGVTVRALVAGQSLFADELSTYWISATHSLGGVLSLMYGTGTIKHAEITPPLYFLLAWLTSQLGHSAEWLRLPSLIAGTLTIPLMFLLGDRAVGRRVGLLAAALTTVAPFMIYYSAEARAYGVMMALVVGSTLSMLMAIDDGRRRWWVLYGICSCAAFYTHYTCAFVLAVQFLWLVWAHPAARRPALITNVAAAAAVIPWIPGLIQDFTSPTLNILSALSPFTLHEIRLDLEHWSIGYPYTLAGGLRDLPGTVALVLLGVAAGLVAVGLAARYRQLRDRPVNRRLLLLVALAAAVPVGEAIVSLGGNHIFGVRNLAGSWPFLALVCAAAIVAAGRVIAVVAAALTLVALGIGAVKMLSGRFVRPQYQAAADYVVAHARPGDVVVDETGALSPGPVTGLDVALPATFTNRVVRAQAPAERDHPYGFTDRIVPLDEAIREATADAAGRRVFLVTNTFKTEISGLQARLSHTTGQFPAPYRLAVVRAWPGIGGTAVEEYAAASHRP